MKLNFKQHAVRLGGWVRPHHAHACFLVVVITSVVYNRAALAQTDSPSPAVAVPASDQTNLPPTSLSPEAVQTNNPPAALMPPPAQVDNSHTLQFLNAY